MSVETHLYNVWIRHFLLTIWNVDCYHLIVYSVYIIFLLYLIYKYIAQ